MQPGSGDASVDPATLSSVASEVGQTGSAVEQAVSTFSGPDGADRIEPEPDTAAEFFGDGITLARDYVTSLASDGVLRGLIGPRESGRLWSRHVLNSAVAGQLLTAGSTVVDVGSGAGLPGVPLAIVRPDCQFVLVEPLERRTKYLLEIVEALGLDNCRVVRGRADEVIGECGGADVVTSRAVAPLAKLAAWSAPLLRIGGELLALKGSSAAEEIRRDRVVVAAVGLSELSVKSCGAGVVDPETLVIHGIRVHVTAGANSRRSGKGSSPKVRRK